MGIEFTGHVLRAPQVASTNAATSGVPDNGVVRDVRPSPGTRVAARPAIVDLAGDQYRCAVLEAPGTTPVEYLVWAANTSQLALVDDPTWWTDTGTGRIPLGNLPVTDVSDPTKTHTDGSARVIVTDDGGRSIGTILAIVVARGDVVYTDEGWTDVENPALGREGTKPYALMIPSEWPGVVSQDADAGIVRWNLVSPFDGLSVSRGDRIVEVRYTIAPAKFWWTRNDRYEKRFGWDGKLGRWRPWRGGSPTDLGRLLFDTKYKLSPKLSFSPIGSFLMGDASTNDGTAVLRVGVSPGAVSRPVGIGDPDGFLGVAVVPDSEMTQGYEFSGNPYYSGVIGQTSGTLEFNPAYVTIHVGKTVWFVRQGFTEDSTGSVGPFGAVDETPLFLAPVPGPTDRPLVRIGSRRHLSVTTVESETDLEAVDEPGSGEVVVASTTGRLRFSRSDTAKADPDDTGAFDKHFLGETVFYDGVALNAVAQGTRAPVKLTRADGSSTVDDASLMYVPRSAPWPEDASNVTGLGVSGILHLPDGTGAVPDPEGVDPSLVVVPVRPGGDTIPPPGGGVPPQTLGLVRHVRDGVGDTIVFSRAGAVSDLVVADYTSELPQFSFQVPGGTVHIAREAVTVGGAPKSAVQLSTADRTRFSGQDVWFLQATLTPAVYGTTARIFSKGRAIFRFVGDETFCFAVDGTAHDWHTSSLPVRDFHTPTEVATSIQARMVAQGGTGFARAVGDRILLESPNPSTGTVEIGWGNPRDLSGAASLGFLPGWRAKGGTPNWLADSGIGLGLTRNPANRDRSKAVPDYKARDRVEDVILDSSVSQSPFVFLDRPPLQDVAGYDEGVFFNLRSSVVTGDEMSFTDERLGHFGKIRHRFDKDRFDWLESVTTSQTLDARTTTLALGRSSVIPESLLGAPGIAGGLRAAMGGGPFVQQKLGSDFLLDEEGLTGSARLVTRHGASVTRGAAGTFTTGGTTFTDLSADFSRDSTEPDTDENGAQRTDPVTGKLVWLPLVRPGFRLCPESGDAEGSYVVVTVTDGRHLEIRPAFPASSVRATPWNIHEGAPDSIYDPSLVADVTYRPFTHLPEEPFRVRTLSPLGIVTEGSDYEAHLGEALSAGRILGLRFGVEPPTDRTTATLTALKKTKLGRLPGGPFVLPASPHVTENNFSLRLGSTKFVHGSGLDAVSAFSADPGTAIEHLTGAWVDGTGTSHTAGELKFGSVVLVDHALSDVWVVEEFSRGVDLAGGEAEYDPETGIVRLSEVDTVAVAGDRLFLTEQMILTDGKDVAVSPTVGAVTFRRPVRTGTLVEMEYLLADVEGRRQGEEDGTTVEFLSVSVRRETAVRVSATEYMVNVGGLRLVDDRVTPIVHIGPMQQNFGREDFTTDRPEHLGGATRITFVRILAEHLVVVVTYAAFDASGGERVYETSRKPVYRPPFFVKAGQDHFGLRGNRTGDFVPGQMLRFGASCFYVVRTRHFAGSDVTRVDIFPPTVEEVGSRSPGNDVLSLVTSVPITTTLDPDGTPVTTTAKAGFMRVLPSSEFSFEPIVVRQTNAVFLGDLTEFAVPGHVMEFAGMPFTVARSEKSEDGTRTSIVFTAPFSRAVDPKDSPTVKLSNRPVYPPETREFLGVGAVVEEAPVTLILYGETKSGIEQPGRTLTRGTEYDLDTASGTVRLLAPAQAPLGSGQRLVLEFTERRVLGPRVENGVVITPRFRAEFLCGTIPSVENGFFGSLTTTTYSFENPDTFYFRALTLRSFLGEAVVEAVTDMQATNPGSGPIFTTKAGTENWKQGRTGTGGERRHLLDKDRAARTMLVFYDTTIRAFEQVDEGIDGGFVGDRDGKFRFFVGRGKEYAPPGWEDPITGMLRPKNVWARVFGSSDPTRVLTFDPTRDSLVEPKSATMTGHVLTGTPLSAHRLDELTALQKEFVTNDIDDELLVAAVDGTPVFVPQAPWFVPSMGARYARAGTPHAWSRLFPQKAGVFFTLRPGVGADVEGSGESGVFTAGRVNSVTGVVESTTGKTIGQVANPVLGPIDKVTKTNLRRRQARARIFSYHPYGLSAVFGAGAAAPCLVVSLVPLTDMPTNPATGFPDATKLRSQNPVGTVPDATTGDPERSLPGFSPGDQIAWGRPDGLVFPAFFEETVEVPDFSGLSGQTILTGVFVHEVVAGCVLTFRDRNGTPITDPWKLLVGTSQDTGVAAHLFSVERSDTVFVVPATGNANPVTDPSSDPLTLEMFRQAGAVSPAYRDGFDLTVRQDGAVVDTSLPSWDDPTWFPLREMSGQNPPVPMSHLEGKAEFFDVRQLPVNLPALLGEDKDDSGDVQIPYMRTTAVELDRFDEITTHMGGVMETDPMTGAVYPDEILFVDGKTIATAVSLGGGFYEEPSTLMTKTNMLPSPGVAVEPARPWDFLMTEVTEGAPTGWQGLNSVGAVRTELVAGQVQSWIEPPRFVTPTRKGDLIRYVLTNYAVFTTPGNYPTNPQVVNPPGVRIVDDIAGNKTILSFADVPLVLNDGVSAFTGNLNSIWAAGANLIRIKLLARPDAAILNRPPGVPPTVGQVLITIRIRRTSVDVTYIDHTVPHGPTIVYGPVGPSGRPVEFGTHDLGVDPVMPTVAERRHVILYGVSGLIPFTPTVGTPSEWFLPHDHLDIGGPAERKVSKYGWEFAIDVDTDLDAIGPTGSGVTARIGNDRLTFHEVLDFRMAVPRGFVHPLSADVYATKLRVTDVTTALGISTVDDMGNLTFLSRTGASDDIGGTWAPASVGSPGTENGTLRVMSFETGNTPVIVAGVTASVLASNSDQPGGPILTGTGQATRNAVLTVVPMTGALGNVKKGDVLVVDGGWDGNPDLLGTEKAGSYVVRHVVPGPSGVSYTAVAVDAVYGNGTGFVKTLAPKVVSFTAATNVLQVEAGGLPVQNGKVFVFLNIPDLAAPVGAPGLALYKKAAFSADIAIDAGNGTLVLGTNSYKWADDSAFVLPADKDSLGTLAGKRTSFVTDDEARLVVSVRGGPLPDDSSVVGHGSSPSPVETGADVAVYGMKHITLTGAPAVTTNKVPYTAGLPIVAPPGGLPRIVGPIVLAEGSVGVLEATVTDAGQFQTDREAVVHVQVPGLLKFKLSPTQGGLLNDPNGHAPTALIRKCLVPGTKLSLANETGLVPGFLAEAGVFLEPSTPQQPYNLDPVGVPHVVVNGHSLPTASVGMRSPGTAENVHFEVRRVRRWHGVQDTLDKAFRPLRFVYETRRGIVTAFSVDPQQYGLVTASLFEMDWNTIYPAKPRTPDVWNEHDGLIHSGTNLGTFLERDVNIHPGDAFRVLDDNGKVLGEAEIVQVVGPAQIRLAPPGLAPLLQADVTGRRFEIRLRHAPVPHEQSNEQLLEILTDKVVHDTIANRSALDPQAWTGGYVPSTTGTSAWTAVSNVLYDDAVTGIGASSFVVKGIKKDDIVIVDPAGTMPVVGARGSRPLGDRGAPGRTSAGNPSPYQVGQASSLDDNRGFYRVTAVFADHLEVSGASLFSGDSGNDKVFAPIVTDLRYVVYPTVHRSLLAVTDAEGQTDLRPTLRAENGSYVGYGGDAVKDKHSIRPFGYRIVRPSNLFSAEMTDTVLFLRERMLSLIELFRGATRGGKGGFWWDFQNEVHIYDLGFPNDPDSGFGLFPNRLVTALVGEMGVSPYLNNTACLSVLDRRFWILDRRLDGLRPNGVFAMRTASGGPAFPAAGGPYTAYTDVGTGGSAVRPVLPDHLGLILDTRDKLREKRRVWMAYRMHTLIGTLARIRRFDDELPAREEEAARTALLQSTTENL